MKVEKNYKYQRAIIENTNEAWKNYKVTRNLYKVNIEKEKNKFIDNKICNTNNQKEMWSKIKELVLRNTRSVIKTVIFNNIEYNDNMQIADNFNNYYVKSIKEINNSIEFVQYENKIAVIDNKFKFRAINLRELKSICKDLNKKTDYNRINKNMILDNWDILGNKILHIVNRSLEVGIFPNNWKESIITPIEKVKNTLKCEEFRPINGLKTCEKILEKIVKIQLEEYVEKYKILSKYQSGFRKKHSCETALNYVINRWKYMKKSNKIVAIFLDFKRAFETLDRDILLKKLHAYGIQNTELKWFQSYLSNRTQSTKINNIKSKELDNDFGVPQGSILGTLLFIIYINDLEKVLEKCEIVLYADDTLIFSEASTDEVCYENLQTDMNKINQWLNMNKLKLNENKTKIIQIRMNNNITFKINDIIIEKLNKIKYLGFIIDKELNFKEHIEHICKKIGKKIGFFKRIRNKLSIITAINIYNTIIKPHFEYGSTILYNCCTDAQIHRLQKLQNKAMRIILKCNRYTSISYMLDILKWMNIHQRLELTTLTFIKKMEMGNAPEYLLEQLQYIGDTQPYNLRNNNEFRLQRSDTNSTQRSLFYNGLKKYNELPFIIKYEPNINIFRKTVVNFIRNTNVN